MAARRRYTDAQKAAALAALDANDGNTSRTAQQLSIPRVTLICWANGRHINEDVSNLRHLKKRDLAEALEAIAWDVMETIPEKLGKADLRDSVGALSVALEKMRLLREQATSISESRTEWTEDECADRAVDLLQRARARRAAAGGAGAPAVDAAGGAGGVPAVN